MAVARKRLTLSPADVLEAAGQWDPPELDQAISGLLELWAQHGAPGSEAALLWKINHPWPDDFRTRYSALITKRRAETLTPDEQQELLRLSDIAEQLQLERVNYLLELARLRQVSLRTLMDSPDIAAPVDV